MLRLFRLLEWRGHLKRFQKEGRVFPLLLDTFNTVVPCRILRVGFMTCTIEIVADAEEGADRGVEINVIDIEDVLLAVTRHHYDIVDGLKRQMPDLAALGKDEPAPESESEEDEEGEVMYLELTEEEFRAAVENGDIQLPEGTTIEDFLGEE